MDVPCILYNLNGYYNGLKTQLAHMIRMGLSSREKQTGIVFADDLAAIVDALKKSDGALI